MTIQSRATVLFSVLTLTLMLVFSVFIYLFANHYAFEDFYKRLETRVNLTSDIHLGINTPAVSSQIKTLRQAYLEKLPQEKDYLLKVNNETYPILELKKSGLPVSFLSDLLQNKMARFRTQETFYAGKLQEENNVKYVVVVSAKNPYGSEELAHLSRILLIGFLSSIFLVFVFGRRFTKHTFKPIRQIIKEVKNISAENLNLRLIQSNNKDEITELTQTFNEMLTRLETAFDTQNNFVSNASHELRTPLTIIKGEAELALGKPGLPTEHRQALEKIVYESDKLKDILTSLLGIAQSGFDGKKQNWELIRVDELLWLVKESADQLYPDNKIQIDLSLLPADENQLMVNGNINLLKLAIGNIVLNAYKYSNNQLVKVLIYADKNQLTVSVEDKGIGIPEREIAHIFVPFFRASNTSDFEGHGVGLPLALNIIRLHQGNIGILSEEGAGTKIRINLPLAAI